MSELESATNINDVADSLSSCLKMFAENVSFFALFSVHKFWKMLLNRLCYLQKINKDNAWNINIIDSFSKLISKHHDVLSNFQVAGTTLEASAKVYGLRVDSVHNDVIRMTADLGRQCESEAVLKLHRKYSEILIYLFLIAAKALQRKHNDDQGNQSDGGDKENLDNTVVPMEDQPQQKKARKKRNIATVTQNVKTLNARLETNPMTDPFFAKLNSVVGDTNSSKRLMQNIIPTDSSKLRIPQHTPFWKKDDEMFAVRTNESKSEILAIPQVVKPSEFNKFFVRQGLSNYVLSNSPLEEDKDNSAISRFGDDDINDTVLHNSIHADLQFDINAEVEPVSHDNQVMMDFGDMNNEDFDDLNEMDQVAIQRCKGLKRQAVMIDDMQPVVAANLEYSYRPLDIIDRFWAGPSHWKFRSSRRTMMSIGMRFSMYPGGENIESGDQQQKRPVKKRKVPTTYTLALEDVFNVDEEAENIIMNVSTKKKTQLSNQTISRKWDQKKLKLPQDHKLPHDILEKFLYMSSQRVKTNYDVTFTGDDDGSHAYNYDNEVDRNYCSRLDPTSDTETETNTDMGQMDLNNEFDNNDMPVLPSGVDEIPDVFVGAPEKIEKINIAFARRAKVIDMKQLKLCSWNLISRNQSQEVKFKKLLCELPKVLNRQMAENMSMPLAFYAVLHLCNEKGLGLNDVEAKLQDFNIENMTE